MLAFEGLALECDPFPSKAASSLSGELNVLEDGYLALFKRMYQFTLTRTTQLHFLQSSTVPLN